MPDRKPFFAKRKHPIEVIAHRGGGGEWPGETCYAFERALKAGADVLEMDVHQTRDGVLVLMHDKELEITTNGSGKIKEHNYRDIKDLDAAYTWPMHRGRRIKIPRLEDVFDCFPNVRLNIEIKQVWPSLVPALCKLIRKKHKEEEVLIASGWPCVLRKVRRQYPELATSASVCEVLNFRVFNDLLRLPGGPATDALQWHSRFGFIKVIRERFVAAAHKAGLEVHGWTVNEHEEMHRLISLNIDGIMTDYPTKLLGLLERSQPEVPLPPRGLP